MVKLYGGSMKVSEVQTFLEESYQDPPKPNILGYMFDEELSKKVYTDESDDCTGLREGRRKKSNC